DLLCWLQPAADQRHHLDAVDVLDPVEMPNTERARSRERDLDSLGHVSCSPGSDGRRRCCSRARGRGGAAPSASCRPGVCAARRGISHITSSMPSLPASRTYSRCGTFDRPSGSSISRSRNAVSHSLLISPARGPCNWWLMPPVPQTCTLSGSS